MHLYSDNYVEQLFWGKFPIQKASSFFYYTKDSNVQQLLFDLKYHGNNEIGIVLGRIMSHELNETHFFDSIDYILPLPLHKKKEKKRGYNQSEYLSIGISQITKIPLIPKHIIVRNCNTETQTHKQKYERWENVENIFSCLDSQMLENKHLLIVDDVLTTGATICSCANCIKDIKGIKISVLTLALAHEQ